MKLVLLSSIGFLSLMGMQKQPLTIQNNSEHKVDILYEYDGINHNKTVASFESGCINLNTLPQTITIYFKELNNLQEISINETAFPFTIAQSTIIKMSQNHSAKGDTLRFTTHKQHTKSAKKYTHY